MRKLHAIIVSACVGLGGTAAYAQQAAVAPATQAAVEVKSLGEVSAIEAVSLMAKGDNWAGTNVLKARLVKNDTPLNRFNLATGYQRTGRIDQAQALYQDLLKRGRTTNAVETPAAGAAGGGLRVFNLADESASRLLYISWLKSGRTPNAPASADSFATDTSARVGGPTHGDVTDEQALALDRLAHEATH